MAEGYITETQGGGRIERKPSLFETLDFLTETIKHRQQQILLCEAGQEQPLLSVIVYVSKIYNDNNEIDDTSDTSYYFEISYKNDVGKNVRRQINFLKTSEGEYVDNFLQPITELSAIEWFASQIGNLSALEGSQLFFDSTVFISDGSTWVKSQPENRLNLQFVG